MWAPPGKYTVVLTANSQRRTANLTVAPDPRVNLPGSAYVGQFALARQIEAARAALSSATEDASALIKSKPDLAERVKTITGGPGDMFPAPPPPETSIRFVADKLASLQNAVEGADAAPTQDARDAWAKLKPAADAALRAWSEFKTTVK